jgi:hypothetical protein
LRKCPNHNISIEEQVNIFCNGLRPDLKMILDAAAGESMMLIDADGAYRIINSFVTTDRQVLHDRRSTQRKGMLDLNTTDAILAQNRLMSQ